MSSSPLPADLFTRPSRRVLLGVGVTTVAASLLPACSEVTPEPRKIKWGRDVCEFCHMVFGDRRFAAQIWDASLSRARIYDDFGCAVLAADELGLLGRDDVRFWVSDDLDPTRWIDARSAHYRDGVVTPMGYGHSAASTAAADHPLGFLAAATAIRDKAACEHKT